LTAAPFSVWLTQAAKNYDPEVKGARIWVEHMRSVWSDSPFSAQGDVVALKAEEIKTASSPARWPCMQPSSRCPTWWK
jgi:hypothetical protein